MEVYLDNSATTRCYDEVAAVVARTMVEDYGNPSSMHYKGVEAEGYMRRARSVLARSLKVKDKEIFFTSGGTESDNLALIGAARANWRAGKRVLASAMEHPAVLNTMQYLAEEGFEVRYLPVDSQGIVKLDALEKEMTEDTILVSVMYVNNEVGSVQPVADIARVIKKRNPQALFHVDAVQAYGKYDIRPKRDGIDLLSISGHKIHGPKGIGVLYVDEKAKIRAINYGGGQQGGMRSGTDNVPGIAGIAKAAELIYAGLERDNQRLYALKEQLAEGILDIEGTVLNGPAPREGAPHILNASFLGIRSEVLLHALEERGICVSAGSACSSNHPSESATLAAMFLPRERIDSALRFSLGVFNTEEEISFCVQALKELVPALRRYQRR